jgi:hypothetical protein
VGDASQDILDKETSFLAPSDLQRNAMAECRIGTLEPPLRRFRIAESKLR